MEWLQTSQSLFSLDGFNTTPHFCCENSIIVRFKVYLPHGLLRCQDGSLQTLRKSLLEALSLQTEPRLPAGVVDSVREQWQRTSSGVSPGVQDTAGM